VRHETPSDRVAASGAGGRRLLGGAADVGGDRLHATWGPARGIGFAFKLPADAGFLLGGRTATRAGSCGAQFLLAGATHHTGLGPASSRWPAPATAAGGIARRAGRHPARELAADCPNVFRIATGGPARGSDRPTAPRFEQRRHGRDPAGQGLLASWRAPWLGGNCPPPPAAPQWARTAGRRASPGALNPATGAPVRRSGRPYVIE